MRTINERMNSFKRSLRGEANDDGDWDGDGASAANHMPAGCVSCLTCGKTSHRGRSRSPLMSQQRALHDASTASALDKFSLSMSDDSISREDYEQMLSVLRGEAGLKSLSRQSTPLKQKPNSYLKKSNSNDLEPLYRRAKLFFFSSFFLNPSIYIYLFIFIVFFVYNMTLYSRSFIFLRYASQLREIVKISPDRVNPSSLMYRFETTDSALNNNENAIGIIYIYIYIYIVILKLINFFFFKFLF